MLTNISRRRMLATVAGVGAVIGSIAVQRARAAGNPADGQLRKQDVNYQDGPKGNQRCDLCGNFLAPSGCRVVSGGVSPNGWCLLFKAKQQ
jgi:hypothetical protein